MDFNLSVQRPFHPFTLHMSPAPALPGTAATSPRQAARSHSTVTSTAGVSPADATSAGLLWARLAPPVTTTCVASLTSVTTMAPPLQAASRRLRCAALVCCICAGGPSSQSCGDGGGTLDMVCTRAPGWSNSLCAAECDAEARQVERVPRRRLLPRQLGYVVLPGGYTARATTERVQTGTPPSQKAGSALPVERERCRTHKTVFSARAERLAEASFWEPPCPPGTTAGSSGLSR